MWSQQHYLRSLVLSSLLLGSLPPQGLWARPLPPAPPAKKSVAQPPKARLLATVEGITEYVLPNGLRVLLFPDPSSAVITVNITYLVGSRHEGYGETGMAHLLEHLLFKGSKNHRDIPGELSARGARPNGTTWYDRTNYFETFQASRSNLEWALDLESDRMVNSFIAKKDLDSEMTVVRNEFESGENNPGGILSERVLSTAFLWHNYGKSTIGARSDIEKVPIERLQAFYRRYYQPDNAILIVAGKIDPKETLELVERKFGPIPRPKRNLIPTYTEEPVQDGERSVTLRRVGDVQVAMAAYHCPPGSHPDFAAVDIMGEILSDTPSGRLYKALVESGKAVEVGGGSYQLREPGISVFSASLRKEGNLQEAADVLLKTLEEFAQTPPTEAEVERARTNLLKQIEQTLSKSERLALQLSEWAALGDWRHFFLYRDRLEKVTPADVQKVAQNYLIPSNRTLGKFIPTDAPQRATVPWVENPVSDVKNYQGRPPIAEGEAFVPTTANCDARDQRRVLPGGLKLSTFAKKTRGNTVNLSMALRISSLEQSRGAGLAPGLVAAMLMRGSQFHTREQIADEFDRLRSRVSIRSSANSCTVSIETTQANLIPTLKLVYEILRYPAWNAKEFELAQQEVLASAEQMRTDPESLAENVLSRHLSPYPKDDPRYEESPEELVQLAQTLTLDQLRSYYTRTFGASEGEIAVVGDFDQAELEKSLQAGLGDWKSPSAYQRIPNDYFDVSPLRQTVNVSDKANAVVQGGLNLKLRDDNPDYPALVLGNYILGGGFLNSRLATRIRQKEGLSYGVGSFLSAGSLDDSGSFGVYAICAPENAARVEAAMGEEVERALRDGFTAQEVEAARSGLLQRREGSRSSDASLAGTLVRYQALDRRFTWDEAFEARLRQVTAGQIQAALRKHIQWDKLSLVRAGNFPQP